MLVNAVTSMISGEMTTEEAVEICVHWLDTGYEIHRKMFEVKIYEKLAPEIIDPEDKTSLLDRVGANEYADPNVNAAWIGYQIALNILAPQPE